jgi:protein-L-isoaspartate O-methyltransferase
VSSKDNNITFYSENSALLFSQYQSISFENVHYSWIQAIDFTQYKAALDIGAGSGRGALALGQAFTGDDVTWINDTLPELEKAKIKAPISSLSVRFGCTYHHKSSHKVCKLFAHF